MVIVINLRGPRLVVAVRRRVQSKSEISSGHGIVSKTETRQRLKKKKTRRDVNDTVRYKLLLCYPCVAAVRVVDHDEVSSSSSLGYYVSCSTDRTRGLVLL